MKSTNKRFLFVILVTALLVVTFYYVNKLLAVDQTAEQQAAIEAAYRQTGFSPDGLTATVRNEVLSEANNIPFMNLTGKSVWRITIDGINITVKHGDKVITNDKIHSLDVFLDKDSMQIIKVTTNTGSLPDSDYYNFYSPDYQTGYFKSNGISSMATPQQKPGVTLVQALQSAEDGLGGITQTPQFEAIYVVYTKKSYTYQPDDKIVLNMTAPVNGWFVTLKYLPPSPISQPIIQSSKPLPEYKPARYATVVHEINADTGKWIYAGKTQISDDFLPK